MGTKQLLLEDARQLLGECGPYRGVVAGNYPLGDGQSHHQDLRLALQALPAAMCDQLADALLQRVESPSTELRDLIIRGAEGNPFYMEELTKMLIDQRVIVPADGKWEVIEHDTVLESVRRVAHARAAAWLAEHVNERSREYLATTAEHFERAGERARAADYFARAAQDAEGRFANDVATEHARRALVNLAADDVPARFAMLRLLDRVLDVQGRRAEQQALHDEMETLAPPGEISLNRAVLLISRSLLADRLGDFITARQRAIETIQVAEAAGAWPQAARGYAEWAYVSTHFADHALAREKAARALECARKGVEVLAVTQALAVGAYVEGAAQNHAKAATLVLDAIALARQHGHRRLEGLLQGNLAGTLHLLGDEVGARAHQLEGLFIARELGIRSLEGNSLCTLSEVTLALGDAATALDFAQRAVAISTSLNDRYFRAMSLMALGEAQRATGDPESAFESFTLARSLFEEAAVPGAAWQAAGHLSELALARGELNVAMSHLAQLVELPADNEMLDSAPQPQRIRLICHRVLTASGDARAADWLAAAHAALESQAAQLTEPMRERFLEGIAHHREILAAWRASR